MKAGLFLLACVLGTFAAASAQQPQSSRPLPAPQSRAIEPDDTVFRVLPGPGNVLYVTGLLEAGSFIKFRRVLNAHPRTRTIYLASPGGLVLEGYLIGSTVRERKLATYVEYLCASACTLILASGTDRAVAPGAQIGFHQSHTRLPDGSIQAESLASAELGAPTPDLSSDFLQRTAFERAGITEDFITRALETPFDAMWYPTKADLLAARIVTRSSAGGEVKILPELGRNRETLLALMIRDPLWGQVQLKEPALFERAVDMAWRASQSGASDRLALFEAHGYLAETLVPRLATAQDVLVEDFIRMASGQTRRAQGNGIPMCMMDTLSSWAREGDVEAIVAEESPLFARMLDQPEPVVTSMTVRRARKIIAPIIRNVAAGNGLFSGDDCEAGGRLVERISELPPKKRIAAFRALITLGLKSQDPGTGPAG